MGLVIEEEIEVKYFTIPFDKLVSKNPQLAIYTASVNPVKFDLGNPEVLSKVNHALFKTVLDIDISVPKNHLIPTLGIRYAYCDVVATRSKSSLPFIEIGTGASAAIALILAKKYKKQVLATEINQSSILSAKNNLTSNDVETAVTLMESKGEIIQSLIPSGKYSALLCYPPLYEQDLTRLQKKRGWKGTYDELIGGGADGMDFIRQLIKEILDNLQIEIEVVSLMLSNKQILTSTITLLPKSMKREIIQLNAGTRKRFILIFYPGR